MVGQLPVEAAEHHVRRGDDRENRIGIGAVGDVELGGNQLLRQGDAGIVHPQVQQEQQLALGVRLAAERQRPHRPIVGVLLPVVIAVRTRRRRWRRRRRQLDLSGRRLRPGWGDCLARVHLLRRGHRLGVWRGRRHRRPGRPGCIRSRRVNLVCRRCGLGPGHPGCVRSRREDLVRRRCGLRRRRSS